MFASETQTVRVSQVRRQIQAQRCKKVRSAPLPSLASQADLVIAAGGTRQRGLAEERDAQEGHG